MTAEPDEITEELPEEPQGPPRDERGRWLPGQSGNPGGKPPGGNLMHELAKQIELEHDETGRRKIEVLVEKLLTMAIDGDTRAMDLILRRLAPEKFTFDLESNLPLVIIRDYTSGAAEILDAGGSLPQVPARLAEPGGEEH